ncbi:MAG: hypothetical protein IJJ81_00385 [Ruminococcus sp.]|nr:hypothetical protein [Ruminococcus sp.]
MKNDFQKPKDNLIIIRAIAAWWLLSFSIIFSAATVIDLLSSAWSGVSFGKMIMFRVVFSAVSAVPLAFIVYFLVIPRVNRQFRIFRRIVSKISDEGYSDTVIKEMEAQLQFCMTMPASYATYRNQYAMFLTEAYMSLHDYDMAEEKLGCVDYEFMKSELRGTNTISLQRNILLIHVLRVQLAAERGDIRLTEERVASGEKVFSLYRNKSEMMNYLIDTAYFESLLVHEQFENAIRLLDKYKDNEEIRFGYYLDKGRCLMRMGRRDQADEFFDKAYDMAANDWRRQTVDLERNNPISSKTKKSTHR